MKMTSHKELARRYGVHVTTLTIELSKIPTLRRKRNQRMYTPKQLKIIYAHLGDPSE